MRYPTVFVALGVLGFVAVSSTVAAQGWTGNVNFTLGAKALDEDDWEPVEDQAEIGIDVDFRPTDWPVSLSIAFLASENDDEEEVINGVNFDLEGRTSEFRFGVRKIWEPTTTMRPYFGGGLAFIWAEFEGKAFGVSMSDDDSGVGVWLGGGVYWTLGQHFNIGFDLAWSKAEVTLFGTDGEAGGGHAGLLLGYHW